MGTVSRLASGVFLAHPSNYQNGRNGYKVCKITPHIMAGILTAEQCAVNVFGKPNKQASANYCIGYAGEIVCNVYEDDRSFCSSNRLNDWQAITIEISNDVVGGDWHISDASWNSLVELCVDICTRHEFRLEYDGTPNGSLTRHNMFANKTCPGAYLQSRLPELAQIVNDRLGQDDGKPEEVPVPEIPKTTYKVGDVVTINGIYTASNSTKKLNPARTQGTITRIIPGAYNPYLLDNGNLGWTNDTCITSAPVNESGTTPEPAPSTGRKVGDKVNINGVYSSSTSTKKLNPARKQGTITQIIPGRPNPYLLDNGNLGWVNDDCIVDSTPAPQPAPAPSTGISKGDKVKVREGAKTYTGGSLASFVYNTVYDVIEVSGDRVVIGKGSAVTAAVKKSDVYRV